MKRLWRDTLFKRLFILMWVALVVSHLVAFTVVTRWLSAHPPGAGRSFSFVTAPVLPSLPPTPGLPGPRMVGGRPPPEDMINAADGSSAPFMIEDDGLDDGPSLLSGLPTAVLVLDYGVRFLIIGIAAWFGARWVSAPMRRLVGASGALVSTIGSSTALPSLDEKRGTFEVREAAHVFNGMARQLDDQFKGRSLMAAAISHDLRTPLTRMRMRLESLEAEPAAQRCIADVREMNELIDSSLDLFRGAGYSEQVQAVDVQSLVQSLCDDMVEQGHRVSASGHAAVVHAQPAALRRILGNLIGNAVRYGDGADVMVLREAEGVKIVIDDSGPGIPPQQLEAVFQPFYRVEGSRNRSTGGTGLGLYIARDLVERQHGKLSLINRREGGLRATVFLPHRQATR